jgi:hypothetical protein
MPLRSAIVDGTEVKLGPYRVDPSVLMMVCALCRVIEF